MHFGFVLELSNIDLWNIDLLDTDIANKYFACLHNVLKTSSRHVLKTSSRHVFKTSWSRLQRNNFLSSKTSSRRLWIMPCKMYNYYAEDVLKMSWRCLQDQQMFAGKLVLQSNRISLTAIKVNLRCYWMIYMVNVEAAGQRCS